MVQYNTTETPTERESAMYRNDETDALDFTAGTLDERDIRKRFDYLKEKYPDPEADPTDEEDPDAEAERAELRALINSDADQLPDSETLIHESYFEDYARELAEDIGALEKADAWPFTCIDWEKAADDLKMDYSVIELDGNTYYYRY